MKAVNSSVLQEISAAFFKLGWIAFGGPAAHIAMFDDEFVRRRKWVSREHFLDLIGATNLIPGPNSTEMTMHLGYERGGWRGLFVAGLCFIGPAAVLTVVLAWLYVRFGSLPNIEPFLYGVKPAVIAIILGALGRLGKKAIKRWELGVLAAVVCLAVLLGVGEITALAAGGLMGTLLIRGINSPSKLGLFLTTQPLGFAAVESASRVIDTVPLWKLGLFFLKIGAILYGSGYVLVAFLEGELVGLHGWITQAELLDAIAIGQFTPGPVLTTATFIGFIIGGIPGAVIATFAIFLPSFVFVLILNPLIPKMRKSPWIRAFLDAVNAAAVALMAAVTIELGYNVLIDWRAWLLALVAGILVIGYRVSAVWIVVGSAIGGWLLAQI